jgi:Tol biopolymer transport system component/DNA-binding winged helix-turn-helix (wHTH) protein
MSNKTLTLYKFDDFCLDTNRRCLLYADSPVSLTPKAYQTLLVLLRHRGEIVDKEFLLNEVWADTFVEETTLSQNILTLRKALRTFQKEKEFIVTFPRRGFRFVADVEESVVADEVIVIEKHTRTHIVADREIHDSADTEQVETAIKPSGKSTAIGFLNARTFVFGLSAIIFSAVGYFGLTYFGQSFAVSTTQKAQVQTLVSDTEISNAVLSPNGKYLAVVEVKDERQSLSLRQIENGNTLEIVPKLIGTVLGVTFSPDNEYIFYSVAGKSGLDKSSAGMLYKVPIFGGASQKILDNIAGSATVSPDNKHFAFIRQNPENNETVLIIADIDGKSERISAIRKSDEGFTSSGAAWSPDGKFISAAVNLLEDNKKTMQIAVINTDTGELKVLTRQAWGRAGQTAWLKNGAEIAVMVYRESSPTLSDELWLVATSDGSARYLTNAVKGTAGFSLDEKTNSIIAVRTDKLTCFLSASLDKFRQSNHISTRIGDACLVPVGADWTNDGKIIYSTMEGGNADIWTTDENGGGKKQLTSDDGAEISPQISKDGRTLIFLSNRSGKMSVWRANPDGTNQTRLTEHETVNDAIISPAGDTIFYVAQNAENTAEILWKMSVTGENKTRLTAKSTKTPRLSPDGKTIACYFPNGDNKMSLTLLSAETGEVLKYPKTPPHEDIPFLDWSKNGENLFVIMRTGKPFSLWKISLNNADAEKMREWENDAIFRFVISKDGERVFYEVGTEISSVIRLDGLMN